MATALPAVEGGEIRRVAERRNKYSFSFLQIVINTMKYRIGIVLRGIRGSWECRESI
jgi:hypothetical protein